MKYIALIKPNGEITAVPVNKDSFLADLQRFVGGYIEIVWRCDMLKPNLKMVINEEGKLAGLPYNPVASQVWGGKILGNAVIVRQIPDDIAPFDSKSRLNELVIEPLKAVLIMNLESHDDE